MFDVFVRDWAFFEAVGEGKFGSDSAGIDLHRLQRTRLSEATRDEREDREGRHKEDGDRDHDLENCKRGEGAGAGGNLRLLMAPHHVAMDVHCVVTSQAAPVM